MAKANSKAKGSRQRRERFLRCKSSLPCKESAGQPSWNGREIAKGTDSKAISSKSSGGTVTSYLSINGHKPRSRSMVKFTPARAPSIPVTLQAKETQRFLSFQAMGSRVKDINA